MRILDFSIVRICLYKQGFIDLSGILQAVKCHAASSERKEIANPSTMYAIFPNTLIDAIFSNILIEIRTEEYKTIGYKVLRMIGIRYNNLTLQMF